jgi:hypothetical protein
MEREMLDSYRAYVRSQCSYYSPENPEFLSGEIIHLWFQRKSVRREMTSQETELSRIDGVLSGLMYEQKKRLSRLGRNGGWSKWLAQHKIPRATADRLCMEHVEFFGLQHELATRERPEPLEGNISLAACRTSDRLEQMLKSPRSRMMFLSGLADRFGIAVDFGEGGSVRLSIPPPEKAEDIDYRVPNVAQIDANGKLVPVDCELREEDGDNTPLVVRYRHRFLCTESERIAKAAGVQPHWQQRPQAAHHFCSGRMEVIIAPWVSCVSMTPKATTSHSANRAVQWFH